MLKLQIFFVTFISFFPAALLAQEMGITGGFHFSQAHSTTAGDSEDGKIGYKLGAVVRLDMVENLNFRSGLIYSYRPFDFDRGTLHLNHKFSYLDIPALVEFKAHDQIGLFGGLVIGLNVDDKVTGGRVQDVNEIIALAQVGASFNFDDLYGFDLYVERGLGDIYDGAEDLTSIGANFTYWL